MVESDNTRIITIRDFADPRLDPYARLSEAQLLNRDCPSEGRFIAESPKVIERALNAGYEPVSLLCEDRHVEGEAKEIISRTGNIPVFCAPYETLVQLTGFALTRGVLCLMRRKPLPETYEICGKCETIAVLEDVMNPTNVGAIIRSAAALNIGGVILTQGSSNPLYRRAIRVSMGTVFQIPWTIAGDDWMTVLKKHGFTTVAMALEEDSVELGSFRRNGRKTAVILGTEGDGLRSTTIADCDTTVRIPMANGVDSLNVAAASAVAFWQIANVK